MEISLRKTLVLLASISLFCSLSYGQISSTAPLHGVVSDPTGAVIPGVTVVAKNNATNAQFETLTIENGTFVIPALTPGVYTITVTLSGFKQAVVPDVKIDAGTPATVRVTLQIGDVSESVTVEAGAEILQTQTATVTTTIDVRQVLSLPVSRGALDFATLLPGVSQTGDSRSSRINGLSRNAVNVTIDGINTQEYLKDSDFFSYISPRTDAVEEVSVSTAVPGAEASGQGGVQVKMVTRQGSNEWHGGLYEYHENGWLNANSWFNNRDLPPDPTTGKAPRNRRISNNYGGRIGGPLIRDRVFFFVNMEETWTPNQVSRTQTIFYPATQTGTFRYLVGATGTEPSEVNLLTLAAANGQTSTIDPTIQRLLADIRSATGTAGGINPHPTDPNLQRYAFQNVAESRNRFPTIRLDFNLTSKHHLETSYWYQKYKTFPDTLNTADPSFPGFPNVGGQTSDRFSYSIALRSTLRPTIVNEFRSGAGGGTVRFSAERSASNFLGPIANQQGFALGISAAGISNAHRGAGNSRRNTPNWSLADTLNWQRGAHSISLGLSFMQATSFLEGKTAVPSITMGVDSTDPANAMFTTANFPGASTAQLNAARSIYAVLTGRVTAINANGLVDEKSGDYVYLGADVERGRQREWGFFATDSWRVKPSLTVNYGLRWEIQGPYAALNNRYTTTTVAGLYGISGEGNLFSPGASAGTRTALAQLQPGESVYATEKGNFAPSFGFAWSPKLENTWLRRIFGEESVIRGGYSIAYIRRSNSLFNDGYDNNPGSLLTLNRNINLGNLATGQGTDRLPVLLREPQRLGPPSFSKTPAFPYTGYLVSDDVTIFDPKFKVPYVQSWSFGVQRELSRSMAFEIRYVGNRSLQNSETINLNEVNLLENGFMEEFKRAQANLQANMAAGRGSSFRYAGPGTNTLPLPILLGYLTGSRNANDAAAYTQAAFSNATLVNRLAAQNPAPYTLADDLTGDAARRNNAVTAGLPRNLFFVNPDLDDVNLIRNGGYTNYHSLVLEFRRRMTSGLQLNSSYVWSKTQESDFISLRKERVNSVPTTNIPHVLKANWVYEVPIGNGRRLLSNINGVLDRVIGGWEVSGTTRLQTGDPINVGNVVLVGMTRKDLQNALQIRFDDANKVVYSMPQDIIDNTLRANNVSATSPNGFSARGVPQGRYITSANGPNCIELYDGDCGSTSTIVYGPRFFVLDLSLAKRFTITEKTDFEFRAEMFNALNNTNFSVGLGNRGTTFGQVTSADGARSVRLIGRFNF